MMIKPAIRRCHVLGDNFHEDEDTFALYEVIENDEGII